MRRLTVLLMAVIMAVAAAGAQTRGAEAYPISTSQKGIRVSTDVFAAALPLSVVAYTVATSDWKGLKQGALTAATTIGAVYALKLTIHKRRPDRSNNLSFPSMHTAAGFASAAFWQRRYGWGVGAPAYMLATYIGWGRIYSKRHDFWDVLTGAAIGMASAYIFTTPFAEKHDLRIAPTAINDGFALSMSLTF